ncbi:MAG TPA: TonB-dependent receptor [Steroidobacteraceae bacterium]|jgi:TonB-dependent receptor|nr:TonB-dependent receptor [Steroidobacteraceae bacterium]
MSKKSPLYRISLSALTGIAGFATCASAADEAASPQSEEVDTVVVTGFRASLESSTNAKRDSTNFTDSVFAEDIGKFPDLNIAESLNRIPGIQLTREINGEGLNIAIRGLGTNFTKTILNGAQIAVASSGRTDAQNQNRELDLDLFPTELFTRLDVNKTPVASMIEGGVSGTVNMRSARPFDNPGTHLSYQLQGNYGEISGEYSPRAAITGSWSNETFGVLIGLAGVSNKTETRGYETIGWTNANLSDAQCGVAAIDHDNNPATAPQNICNYAIGGNGFTIPATVPATAGNGLTPGATIDAAFLQANNPGVTARQLGEAILPRLSRPAYVKGTRDRYSGLVSLEYRPTDSMRFYADTMYADAKREFDRLDMNWVVRNSNWMVPINTTVDDNGVFTSGTFANSQFFLEARPYNEEVDFWNFNPGAHFDFGDRWQLDVQLNKSRSLFFREAPTVLVNSPAGITVNFQNEGGNTPIVTASNLDFNDPNAGWTWAGGRVNIQNEKRLTKTSGAHADLRFGDDKNNIRVGGAYDEISRGISGRDNSARWEDVVCRNGLDANGNSPTTGRAPCNGLNPNSAIPQSALASYLKPGPAGFITVDFDRFMADSQYKQLSESAPESNGVATGASSGGVNERTLGAYVEFNGSAEFFDRPFRFNLGGRYVQTDQAILGPVTIGGVRQEQTLLSDYDAFLPAFNAAVNLTDDVILRMSGSRTLTRANPSAMLPNTTFSDPSAQQASQGNPNLSPFMSTNFDLGGEWYTGEEGYVGLTLFTKQISGFTVNGTNTIPFTALGIPYENLSPTQQAAIDQRGGPNVAVVTVTQQVNASGVLNIQGYEAIWVQPLNFVLQGLGFSSNYTRVSQHPQGTGVPAQAVGISPTSYNFTAYYENHGATVRLSYNHNAAQISSGLGQNGIPYGQYFTDAYGQLDMSASYEFSNLPTSPQITLNVTNITGEHQRSTFVYDNATWTFYDPGYSILLGIRGKF